MTAFIQILSSYINVKKEIAVHITPSIILRRHGCLNFSTGKLKKKGKKDTKNMYICININSRVTELYHTLRSIEDNMKLLGVKIQNEKDTQVSLVKKDGDIKSVKDCQSSLSNLKNRKQKHIQETPHTLCGTHTLCRELRLSL